MNSPRLHPLSVIAVFNSIDMAAQIVSYLNPKALLPVLLSCKRLKDAVRLQLKLQRQLLRSAEVCFVSSLSSVAWAIKMGCRSDSLCRAAATIGSLHVLIWLREGNTSPVPWGEFVCTKAAAGGHLHVLRWLREENDPPCPWDWQTCAWAAHAGHLHVLKYLRYDSNPPCPWNKWACALAALGGHLHVLQWLREENEPPCPWSPQTLEWALLKGHHHVTQWLHEGRDLWDA